MAPCHTETVTGPKVVLVTLVAATIVTGCSREECNFPTPTRRWR